jgi:hypothetical protein
MTKYTMAFYLFGVLAGILLTPARQFLRTKWFWAGAGLAFLICLPNLIWQIRHDFISYQFLQHIHARDVGEGRTQGFWRGQFLLCVNRFAAPLWIAGLVGFLLSRRYRMLAWMYLVPVLILWLAKGRDYYTGAAYPMLLALGAVLFEHGLKFVPRFWRVGLASAYLTVLVAWGAYVSLAIIPWSSGGKLKSLALENNGDLREEIGWDDLVKTVANIRDSLPQAQRNNVGILVGNYGEQGAIEILGHAYHLPPPISGTNSAWYRSYPRVAPPALIVLGFSREKADRAFTECRLAGHNGNSEGVHNEESDDHPEIFVCKGPRLPWPEFWKKFQRFG